MPKISLLVLFAVFWLNPFAQLPEYHKDTSVVTAISRLIQAYSTQHLPPNESRLLKMAKLKADTISQKIDFIDAVVAASYTGGGKSGTELRNDLVLPVLSANSSLAAKIHLDVGKSIGQTMQALKGLDSLLNIFYTNYIKNKEKGQDITGDDDDTKMVEVEVHVLETFAGKKELAGFEVYCVCPFSARKREDFNPTLSAKRLIPPGAKVFYIHKGHYSQHKLFRIVYRDPHTHIVKFSNTQSVYTK